MWHVKAFRRLAVPTFTPLTIIFCLTSQLQCCYQLYPAQPFYVIEPSVRITFTKHDMSVEKDCIAHEGMGAAPGHVPAQQPQCHSLDRVC